MNRKAIARQTFQVPVRLVSTTAAQSAGGISTIGLSRVMPALFTTAVIGPNAFSAEVIRASTASGSPTSHGAK